MSRQRAPVPPRFAYPPSKPHFGHLPTGLEAGRGFPGDYPDPGRHGIARPIDDQRIGNQIVLNGFGSGTPIAAYPKVRLLDISLQKIAAATSRPDAQFEAGSWVLALQADIVGKQWTGVDPNQRAVCPLLAKIQMGTGTTNVDVEVSPFPSASIPLPCDHVIVDITWDTFRPEDYGDAPGFLFVPDQVVVRATVERSFGSSDARRVFVAKEDAIGVSLLAQVPAMAKRVQVYSGNSAQVYAAGAAFTMRAADPNTEILTGTAAVVTSYTGAELGLIRTAGEMADVPGAARWWLYTAPAMAGPVFVDFEIGL